MEFEREITEDSLVSQLLKEISKEGETFASAEELIRNSNQTRNRRLEEIISRNASRTEEILQRSHSVTTTEEINQQNNEKEEEKNEENEEKNEENEEILFNRILFGEDLLNLSEFSENFDSNFNDNNENENENENDKTPPLKLDDSSFNESNDKNDNKNVNTNNDNLPSLTPSLSLPILQNKSDVKCLFSFNDPNKSQVNIPSIPKTVNSISNFFFF